MIQVTFFVLSLSAPVLAENLVRPGEETRDETKEVVGQSTTRIIGPGEEGSMTSLG